MNKLQVKRLGILSVAKIQSVIGLVVGLILGIIYFFIFAVFGAMIMGMAGKDGTAAGGITIAYGVAALIGFPVFYAIFGFIMGVIVSAIYNLVARFIGGIEFEVENVY